MATATWCLSSLVTSLMDCSITSAISSFMILRSKSASLWSKGPMRSGFEDLLFDLFLRLFSALLSGDRNASFGVVGGSCWAELRLRSDRSVDLDLVAPKIKTYQIWFKWQCIWPEMCESCAVLVLWSCFQACPFRVEDLWKIRPAATGPTPTTCRSSAGCL